MAGIFQMSSGYRDPAKSMTVKALEARLKSAQEASAQATQMQQPISDPMQGYAYLGNILASGLKESRAEYQGGAARDELAKIKAGVDWNKGPTSEQYAAMSTLDPEGADKIMQDWVNYRQDLEKQAKQNEFQTSERLGGETFTAGQQTGRQTFEASQTEDQQQHAIELAEKNQQMDVTEQKRQEQAGIDAIAQKTEARRQEAIKQGLQPGTPEYDAYVLRDAAPPTGGFQGPAGIKAVQEFRQQGNLATSSLNEVNEAKGLVQSGNVKSGAAAKWIVDQASKFGESGIDLLIQHADKAAMIPGLGDLKGLTREQVNATKRIYAITDSIANIRMSQTLKGANTDKEMARFESIFSDPGSTPEMRLQALINLENAFKAERETANASLVASGQQGLDPYEYTPNTIPEVQTPPETTGATTTPAPAPAAAGGGGTAAAAAAGVATPAPPGETPEQREQRLRKLLGTGGR